MGIDEALDKLAGIISRQESMKHTRNHERMSDLLLAYDSVKHICTAKSISYTIDYPFKGMGIITIEGDKVVVNDPDEFLMVALLADNIEIDAKVDGSIRVEITFHGLSNITE